MLKRYVDVDCAPKPVGPYSQGVVARNKIYLSGQIGIDPETNELVKGGIEAETEQVCKNIEAILNAEQSPITAENEKAIEDVIRTTCYLTTMEHFDAFNKVYEKYFTGKPARSCVAVKELPKGALVEIEIEAIC